MRALLRAALALALLLAALAAAGAWWAWRTLHRPYGETARETVIEIPSGEPAGSILRRLEAEGLLPSAALARVYLVHYLGDPPLRAGEYSFRGPLATPAVLDRLIRGEVVTYPVTLVEGLTLEETAAKLAEAGFGDLDSLLAEMRSARRIADLDPEAADLEGYLFPDTYSFARGASAATIVDALVANFRRRYREQLLHRLGEGGEEALRSTVTLASVVETEARLADERPVIAGVYANRLRRGMPLQADPTVIYALKLLGRWDGNIRRPDLALDSPYNTYRYPGLPPGPICSPGIASLIAAAEPADVPYFYFVSRNDGSHVFSVTLAEHNRAVQEWQKDYWRRRWAEERRQR